MYVRCRLQLAGAKSRCGRFELPDETVAKTARFLAGHPAFYLHDLVNTMRSLYSICKAINECARQRHRRSRCRNCDCMSDGWRSLSLSEMAKDLY